jgi:hypothetical protein
MIVFLLLVHSWYPLDCCADRDCHPIDCKQFVSFDDGTVAYHGWMIPKSRIRTSQDNDCHICVSKSLGSVNCVFFPGLA